MHFLERVSIGLVSGCASGCFFTEHSVRLPENVPAGLVSGGASGCSFQERAVRYL